MKSPKKPSKESPLPTQDESRRTNVLFEKLITDFRIIGESLSLVREDVNSLKPRFDNLEQKVDVLESAVCYQGADLRTIKSDVAEIKTDLKNYNQRLEVVEAKLAS